MVAIAMNYPTQLNSAHIEEALDRNEFLLYYQPQVDLTTDKVIGIEALSRWHSPIWGQVKVPEFIKAIENSPLDLIAKFHKWLLHTVFSQIAVWRKIGITIPVYLNFSTRYLQERECLATIQKLLQEYSLPAFCVGIEITESYSIANMPAIKYVIQNLYDMGIQIALDDFCTSFCSLEYLSELPVHKIKIDKQFIQDLGCDSGRAKNSGIIVEAIIDMAFKLEIEVIAEGVETVRHLEQVTYLGCDAYQGYFYSPAVPPNLIVEMVSSQKKQQYGRNNSFMFPTIGNSMTNNYHALPNSA